ncbi:MAG: cold shock domain-containing protein [Erysipelotrichaceae bacterium]
MTTGKVKRFNKNKGFGFITTVDGEDAFFHYSQIVMEGFKTVEEGAEVEFELVNGDCGLQACNIRVVE